MRCGSGKKSRRPKNQPLAPPKTRLSRVTCRPSNMRANTSPGQAAVRSRATRQIAAQTGRNWPNAYMNWSNRRIGRESMPKSPYANMSTRKSAGTAIGPSDRPPGIRTGGAAVLEVGGVVVGHHTDAAAGTGCTVIAFDPAMVVGVDIRGSAPGTREVALLDPQRHINRIDAIVLCGGSALGLGAASGVAEALRARNRGFPTPGGPVPIVPAAVVFDLTTGKSAWPQPHDGAAALERASSEFFACGKRRRRHRGNRRAGAGGRQVRPGRRAGQPRSAQGRRHRRGQPGRDGA